MARIDTSTIAGFDAMTAEEKVAALTADHPGLIDKSIFDKTASELSALKKQSKTAQSDTETVVKGLQDELATMKKEKTVASYKAKYLALGYDEDLAADTAQAMADGDFDKVFANQSAYHKGVETKRKSDALKNNPTPPAGAATVTADFDSKIAAALNRNDFATAAAYMRQKQEATKT